ncbi:MAG: sugar phosphate isomerase/epimerase family protein [Bacillota bacterium]
MKIGLAIAPKEALPSAFVVFREDLSRGISKVARLGYDGVELALLSKDQVDVPSVRQLISRYNLDVPAVSSGQVFADAGLSFTSPDEKVRDGAVATLKGLVEVASEFGAKVNVGRVRGYIPVGEDRRVAEDRFLWCMDKLASYCESLGVEVVLEPVNRYETNFINRLAEGLELLKRLGRDNVKLMPDTFHMNIEEASIIRSLEDAGSYIGYVHVADSNRHAPGDGHLDFLSILSCLASLGYDDYITTEILPYPSPDEAAARAIKHLRHIVDEVTRGY